MRYTLTAGALRRGTERETLCRIRGLGERRRIEDAANCVCLNVHLRRNGKDRTGDVRFHRYAALDAAGREIAAAVPDYAPAEEPESAGWPLSRMPRADRARMMWRGQAYSLTMRSPCRYLLLDGFGQEAACIARRGLAGTWQIDARDVFPPALLCAVFVFCRWLEKENELPMI